MQYYTARIEAPIETMQDTTAPEKTKSHFFIACAEMRSSEMTDHFLLQGNTYT